MVKHNITPVLRNIISDFTNIKCHLTEIQKIIISSSIIITLTLTNIIFNIAYSTNSSALTYSDNVNMQFTFHPTISIDITGDLSIDELVPGGYSDSNVITVTASSNNLSGYTLYSNVGNNSTYNYTELKKSNNDDSNVFNNLTSNKASLDTFDSDSNTWGYSYSVDNGTTWISGDYNNYNTGYNGLPLYSALPVSSIILADTDTNTTSTINFKIGARSTKTQVSGTYTNIINFYAISKQPPTTFEDAYIANNKTKHKGYYTMQDMNTDICKNSNVVIGSTIELIDTRDDEVYRIAKLKDENCWMLDNLALNLVDPSVQSSLNDSTTNASNTTLNYLKNGGGNNTDQYAEAAVANWPSGYYSYYTPLISTNGNSDGVDWDKDTIVTNYGPGSGKIGIYYNYCAASAGSYCYHGSSAQLNATEDICPSNWKIPTGNTTGEYLALYTAYPDAAAFGDSLSVSLSGYVAQSSLSNLNNIGVWWSATRYDGDGMYRLSVYRSNDVHPANDDGHSYRSFGFSVRCLAQ